MTKDLRECIFDGKVPEPGPVPKTKLTYKVGDKIICKCAQWEKGTVVKLWYREELWATGRYAPYQVLLDATNTCVWVPRDDKAYIRPRK